MKTLLIDFNNIYFRTFFFRRTLSFKGKYTGGLHGFITSYVYNINKHKPDLVINCCDTRPLKRESLFPEYKGDRKKNLYNPEIGKAIKEGIMYSKEFLRNIGTFNWEQIGYESDDLIAFYVEQNKDKEIFILSNDSDLFLLTLLSKNVMIICDKKFTDYDLNYDEWEKVKAMSGSHNGVGPLYKGLGEKTAIKIIKDSSLFESTKKKYEKEYERNTKLVKLPFDNDIIIPDFKCEPLMSRRQLENWLMLEFGITITKSMEEAL